MGMTLPVVVGASAREERDDGREAGRFYGLNTLGAVAGTWAAAFFVIPAVGLLRGTWIAAGTDLAVGLLAFGLARSMSPASASSTPTDPSSSSNSKKKTPPAASNSSAFDSNSQPDAAKRKGSERAVLQMAAGWSGAVALALEIAWFRILGLTFGPSVYAFASMLGTYLLGVGLGSWLAGPVARKRERAWPAVILLIAFIGLSALGNLHLLNELPDLYATLFLNTAGVGGLFALALPQILCSILLLLLPCLAMGALFPFLVTAFQQADDGSEPEANVAGLYLWNTLGGILGSLAAGFLLIPRIGVETTLVAASWSSLILALGLAVLRALRSRDHRPLVPTLAGLAPGNGCPSHRSRLGGGALQPRTLPGSLRRSGAELESNRAADLSRGGIQHLGRGLSVPRPGQSARGRQAGREYEPR